MMRSIFFWVGETLTVARDALIVILLLGLLMPRPAAAEGMEVWALIKFTHTSDLFRGPPFNGDSEPTTDYLGFGATLAWQKAELDLSLGTKSRDCNYYRGSVTGRGCNWENGAEISLRWYPWRNR